MNHKWKNKTAVIAVNDVLHELKGENERLSQQLQFANRCVTILLKFRHQLQSILREFSSLLNNGIQEELSDLENEYKLFVTENGLINTRMQNNEMDDKSDVSKKTAYNCLTLREKCEVISAVESNLKSRKEIAEEFNVSMGTVWYICKNKHKYVGLYRELNNIEDDYDDSQLLAINDNNDDQNQTDNSQTDQTLSERENQINLDVLIDSALVSEEKMLKKIVNIKKEKIDRSEYVKRNFARGRNGFKCDWVGCDYEVHNRTKLVEHINATHTGIRPYKCEICSKRFARKFCLDVHRKSHSSEKNVECDICGVKLKSKHSMKFHTMTHTNERPYGCHWPQCEYKTISSYSLEQHCRRVHTKEKPFSCLWPGCDWRFSTKCGLRSHQITHSDKKPFKCDWPECNAQFKRLVLLKNHRCSHDSDKLPLSCDWPGCDFACGLTRQMRMHKIRRHFEKKFRCSWPGCELKFIDAYRMKVHLAQHVPESKAYKCLWTECGKSFATKNRLEAHVAIHKNDKKHKCLWPECDKSFVDAGNMKKHYRIHFRHNQF